MIKTRSGRRSELVKDKFTKKQKTRSDLPLFEEVIDPSDGDIFDDVPDFHRQVKARLLKLGYTSQLLPETTLDRLGPCCYGGKGCLFRHDPLRAKT
jgi:hypothetical protein